MLSGADDSRRAIEEWIRDSFFANRRVITMSGMNDGLCGKRSDLLERGLKVRRIRERQVCPSDRSGKEAVAHQRVAVTVNYNVTGSVPWSVHHAELERSELERVPFLELNVRRRRLFVWDPIQLRLASANAIKGLIELMEINGDVPLSLDRSDRADVIDVRMCNPDRRRTASGSLHFGDDRFGIATRIHDRERIRLLIEYDVAVLLKRTDSDLRDDHAGAPTSSPISSPGASSTWSGDAATGPSAVSRIGDSTMPW